MSIRIKVLEAGHGDALIVETSIGDETFRILIDGGPAECFERRQGAKRTIGPLQAELDGMVARQERFDLTILTHVDDDHIGGLLRACRHEKYRAVIANEVWFNSGRLIAEAMGGAVPEDSTIWIDDPNDRLTSIAQGVEFDDILRQYCQVRRSVKIADGAEIPFRHGKILILSPTEDQLRTLLAKWEKEKPDSLTSSARNDYELSFEELRDNDVFSEDSSVHNASSIAILIEVAGARALFLGDALPSTVCRTLREKLGVNEQNRLSVRVCKLSHHGSEANTNEELLSLLHCEKFIISTNGARHGLPDKMTLARIDKLSPESLVLFNYPGLRKRIFSRHGELASKEKMRDMEGDVLL